MIGGGNTDLLTSIIVVLLIVYVWNQYGSSICAKGQSTLKCGCKKNNCICSDVNTEPMIDSCAPVCRPPDIGTDGYMPKVYATNQDYSGDTILDMALEPEVFNSQKLYINGDGFSGLPTGSSHETTLEETGRDPYTSNFVGLTQRKFCKARALAQPAPDARQVPTYEIKEWCDISMYDLV